MKLKMSVFLMHAANRPNKNLVFTLLNSAPSLLSNGGSGGIFPGILQFDVSRNSLVGITNCCGLGVSGFNPSDEIFHTCPDWAEARPVFRS
jgi:hypothetical protein